MGQLGGEASAEIEAPIDVVWEIVEDVASAPDWQQGLDSMKPLERDDEGRVLVADSTTDAKVKSVTTRVRFSYEPQRRVEWRQEKGDLKSLVGSWELEDLGDRTKATYMLEGDTGRMLGMLIRGPVEGQLRNLLVGGRPDELKKRVEGA